MSCRQDAPTPPEAETVATRFDALPTEPLVRRASPRSVARAVEHARNSWWAIGTRALTSATASTLAGAPTPDAPPGEAVGRVELSGRTMTLRLHDGSNFATFEPRAQVGCDSLAQPAWVPTAVLGSGSAATADAEFVWWQFEHDTAPPVLLRFGPRGIALWRATGDCYGAEPLLALVAGGASVEELASPVTYIGNDPPTETGETSGDKPLRVDLLPANGEELFTAREGIVEMRSAKKSLLHRWKTTLRPGSAACTQAAFHRFDGDRHHLFVELDFNDSVTCDEDWSTRESRQEVFRLDGNDLVRLMHVTMTDLVNDAGESTVRSTYDLTIPIGDGELQFKGSGTTTQVEDADPAGRCDAWLRGTEYDAAALSLLGDEHTARWVWRVGDRPRDIGATRASATSTQCNPALVP